MSAELAVTRSWPVGRYTATLSTPRPKAGACLAAAVEWAPSTPDRLSASELAAYLAGRNVALRDLARELGITVAVVDL